MALPILYHLTARVRPFDDPFHTRAACVGIWEALRTTFPEALAALLMPSHVHVVTPVLSRENGLATFGALLSGFTRRHHPGESMWTTSARTEPIRSEAELRRQIRYVWLNPCRDRLCADPLMWEWSTYRDLMGAAAPIWTEPARLRKHFGYSSSQFVRNLHAYVSGDPSVAVAGTSPPSAPRPLVASQEALVWAVLTAMRRVEMAAWWDGYTPRRVVAHLARRLGLMRVTDLCPLLGVGERSVFRSLATPLVTEEELILSAALNLLSEPRYRQELRSTGKGAGLVTLAGG